MVQPNWYYNLQSGEPESPLGYLLHCLLESRVRLGLPAVESSDEEINVYLGHLLVSAMTPAYREACERYVAPTDADVFEKAGACREPAEKFFLYRANADHQLLSRSVFRAPNDAPPRGEGSMYYHFAAEYNKQIYRRITTISTVLEHLSDTFQTYEAILLHMRHAYLQLWERVSQETLQRWLRSIEPPSPPEASS